MIVATGYGLGWHTDYGISPADVEKTMKTIYAIQIPLFVAVGAIRTSLLLFIQRLSHTCSWSVHILATILLPINIIHILVAIFLSIFRCNPIKSTWDFNNLSYTCIPRAVNYTLVTIGLAIDLAIFLLPVVLVVRLKIKRKKKLQSIVMFALGGGGCIVECLRFSQLRDAETSSDITYTSSILIIFIFFQVILESAPESFEEASISESMGWGPTERIEMETRGPDTVNDKQDKNGMVVKERKIIDLKEVLELDSQKRAALEVPLDGEGPGSARSGSSGRTDEFQAVPVEWGREL
ncbi:uncharacterized protein DFL_005535 [Arthrobotrys flagrans]|uniref:Rhodopsin domain-containing protein n=1 Tax=Arthrobotrys flagrans TaxID=97331 RepID=A0A436ZXN8_ARTFL|nr:hypothetical protein DFL_005535 [Arthrobotrys flagrans]